MSVYNWWVCLSWLASVIQNLSWSKNILQRMQEMILLKNQLPKQTSKHSFVSRVAVLKIIGSTAASITVKCICASCHNRRILVGASTTWMPIRYWELWSITTTPYLRFRIYSAYYKINNGIVCNKIYLLRRNVSAGIHHRNGMQTVQCQSQGYKWKSLQCTG